MAAQARTLYQILFWGSGIGLGAAFTFVIGDISSPHYLLELMSTILVEVPFVAAYALLARKSGWACTLFCIVTGVLASYAMTLPGFSLTPVIFLKAAVTGVILGNMTWCAGSFLRRLFVVSAPGIVFACIFGIPIILHGVLPRVLEEIRTDSLDVYRMFMSEDDALNAIENAMYFFQGVFRVGFAVYILYAVMLSWFSFYFTGWLMGILRETGEYLPPLYTFKMPFHTIWVLLFGAGLWVGELKPVYPVTLNILAVMAGFYGLQGLAIVIYHMNRLSIGRLPKILFWVIFFLTIIVTGVVLVFIGIFDNWFNLRPAMYHKSDKEKGMSDESNSERRC